MNYKKHFTTVTPLSKFIALALFVALPFIGFYLGVVYSQSLPVAQTVYVAHSVPHPTVLMKSKH